MTAKAKEKNQLIIVFNDNSQMTYEYSGNGLSWEVSNAILTVSRQKETYMYPLYAIKWIFIRRDS